MNFTLSSKIFSFCSEAFIEPQNPVESEIWGFRLGANYQRKHQSPATVL
jgi:hypothetical protein